MSANFKLLTFIFVLLSHYLWIKNISEYDLDIADAFISVILILELNESEINFEFAFFPFLQKEKLTKKRQ